MSDDLTRGNLVTIETHVSFLSGAVGVTQRQMTKATPTTYLVMQIAQNCAKEGCHQ